MHTSNKRGIINKFSYLLRPGNSLMCFLQDFIWSPGFQTSYTRQAAGLLEWGSQEGGREPSGAAKQQWLPLGSRWLFIVLACGLWLVYG